MKTLPALLLCSVVALATAAYGTTSRPQDAKPSQSTPAAAAATPAQGTATSSSASVDPGSEAAIRKMFEVMDTAKMMEQMVSGMSNNMRPVLMSSLPPGEYREKLADLFLQKFQSKLKVQQLMDLTIPIYAKYFSKEEIEGLTRFYQTALGKKSLSVLPQTLTEIQAVAMKLGQNVGRESMSEVLEEHPELKKALEEAGAPSKD